MRKMNPKHIQAEKDGKIPYEYLVLSVLEDDAYVHKSGADKYGRNNWTIDEILASTYMGAMFRHYKAWCEGENIDPDSGKPHLTHLRACCAVVMDADKHGKLIDDRLDAESKESESQLEKASYEYSCSRRPMIHMGRPDAPTPPDANIIVLQTAEGLFSHETKIKAFGPFPNMGEASYFARSLLANSPAPVMYVSLANVSKLRTKKC